jgi:hypothetical protein
MVKVIYFDNRHKPITITDEAYMQIEAIINENRVCGTCYRPFSADNPCVLINTCLTCFLRRDDAKGLTFAGVLSEDRTCYKFLDAEGFVSYTTTSADRPERSDYETIKHWGFPVMDSFTLGETQVELSSWRWYIHGDPMSNSVLVLENLEYSSGTRRAFLSYKGGRCVFFTRRKGAMRTLWNQAMEQLKALKGDVSSYYESEIYAIIADLASAEYDAQQKGAV